MRKFLLILLLFVIVEVDCGCAGTGFDKHATLMPDSVTAGYSCSYFAGDPEPYI